MRPGLKTESHHLDLQSHFVNYPGMIGLRVFFVELTLAADYLDKVCFALCHQAFELLRQ